MRITTGNRSRCGVRHRVSAPRVLYEYRCCSSAAIFQDAARLIRLDDDLKQERSISMVYGKAVMQGEFVFW